MLVLIGFAATDFVITKTLFAADAIARIRHTRFLITTAAVHMSVLRLGSSLTTGTDTLIPATEPRHEPVKGKAIDRALTYIAHGECPHAVCPLFGRVFGTIYDVLARAFHAGHR